MACLNDRYQKLVAQNFLSFDPKQQEIIDVFDNFLASYTPSHKKKSWLSLLKTKPALPFPQGFYLYGEVGRGKTMLMDLFYDCLPGKKRRVHFHDFMRDIQASLNERRNFYAQHKQIQGDAIQDIASSLKKNLDIICFDEFVVTDIADAMILGRLFSKLFDLGLIFIATSNVAPQNLYQDGLNRQLFLPFIDTLEKYVKILTLDAPKDYRLTKTNQEKRYFFPLNEQNQEAIEKAWATICSQKGKKASFTYKGRMINVPLSCGHAARFSFEELIEQNLGANDFLALCQSYQLFFLEKLPQFDNAMRNIAKRFIIFIDILYDQHALLYVTAQSEPQNLCLLSPRFPEAFEFQRTVSRLYEMQSKDYLQLYLERYHRKTL